MRVACYIDGGIEKNNSAGAIAAVLVSEQGEILWERKQKINEQTTSNRCEYRALILGTKLAVFYGAEEAHFFSDSMLVVQQINTWWAITDKDLFQLHGYAAGALRMIPTWSLSHIPRERNSYADMLCNQVLRPDDRRARRNGQVVQYATGNPRPGWANIPSPNKAKWNSSS